MSCCADNWLVCTVGWQVGLYCFKYLLKLLFFFLCNRLMQLAGKMGIKVRRGPSLASIFILMLLLHTNICRATSTTNNNTGYNSCNGDQDGCLIGDINLEEEFMMASETSRRLLLNIAKAVTKGTSNPKAAAVSCPYGKRYGGCLPKPNQNGKPKGHCNIYNRNCH